MLEFLGYVLIVLGITIYSILVIALIIATIFIVTKMIIDSDLNLRHRRTRVAKAINRFSFTKVPNFLKYMYIEFRYRIYVLNQGPNARYKCRECLIYGRYQRFNKYDYIVHSRDLHGFWVV